MKSTHRLKRLDTDRRGAILVLTAIVMIFVMTFVALTIDIGYLTLVKTQLQGAADATALAGAMELSSEENPASVRANALAAIRDVATHHRNGDKSSLTVDVSNVTFGKRSWNGTSQKFEIGWGDDQSPYNVVKVRAERDLGGNGKPDDRLPLFFAPVFGSSKAVIGAEATASFHPRDIMVVLDFSASMNDDSSFGRISTLGRSYIESNLLTMWRELGSPVYGKMAFQPAYAVLGGVAQSGTIPHIDVTYKRTSVAVVSTSALTQVKLQFASGTTQTFASLTAKTGTFAGTGTNAGQSISVVWVMSGGNSSMSTGSLGEQFTISPTTIKTALGLTGTYPYAGGSWSEYITAVQASTGEIMDAGYRDMFGYMTWLDYLQYSRFSNAETADLWKTSEQPVGVLKDGVDEFINYLVSINTNDQIGLSIYNHNSTAGAILEHALSTNFIQIKDTTRHRQAGHYHSNTNISAGMKVARLEFAAHARSRTSRLMVLMTDGLPNEPTSGVVARAAVVTEANAAKAAKIKILTISLGVLADKVLMQQVADITGGVHFNVPGGASIDSVRAQLLEVFRQIAVTRPLRLVNGK